MSKKNCWLKKALARIIRTVSRKKDTKNHRRGYFSISYVFIMGNSREGKNVCTYVRLSLIYLSSKHHHSSQIRPSQSRCLGIVLGVNRFLFYSSFNEFTSVLYTYLDFFPFARLFSYTKLAPFVPPLQSGLAT